MTDVVFSTFNKYAFKKKKKLLNCVELCIKTFWIQNQGTNSSRIRFFQLTVRTNMLSYEVPSPGLITKCPAIGYKKWMDTLLISAKSRFRVLGKKLRKWHLFAIANFSFFFVFFYLYTYSPRTLYVYTT